MTSDCNRSYCCIDCFKNETVRGVVCDESESQGECDFCGSKGVPLLHVSGLYDAFHNVVRMYHPAESGGTIAPWEDTLDVGDSLYCVLDDDWGVFDESIAGTDLAAELLGRILESGWDDDSGESLRDPYELVVSRPSWLHQTHAENWRDFSYAVLQDESADHFIPANVEEDIHLLGRELVLKQLFRARIGFKIEDGGHKSAYSNHEIGAPPQERAKPGRANRSGEVVLYVAEQPETAVAEVRPARGLIVSVGEFCVTRPIRVLDLVHEPPNIDPFTNEEFEHWIEFWGLMQEFTRSLSIPLQRDDEPDIDYRPSQWLTRWFKKQSFQGIRFPSALHRDGVNIVLFDTNRTEFKDSWLVKIDDVKYLFSVHDANEEPE